MPASANGKSLDAQVGFLFGGPRFFILVAPEAWNGGPLITWGISCHPGGGGITANSLASRRIQVVLPGSRGPKAFEELQAAGIEVVLNPPGTIRQAITRLKMGELDPDSGLKVLCNF